MLGLIALAGCGIKAAPQPPVIRIADTTRDLTVFQDDREAVLSWSYPSSTTSGESLHDLESIQVWRATLLEVEAPPPGEKASEKDLNRALLLAGGELLVELDREGLEAATRGPKLEWHDDLEVWHRDHPSDDPQVLWYAVRTVCCRGHESSLSNIARLTPDRPPAPPEDLRLAAEADGVRLTWVPHEEFPVIIERSPGDGSWSALGAKPLATGEWLDRSAAQGGGWNYRLRSVSQKEGRPRVLGEPGSATGLFYPDIYPPAAPDDLVCLPEGTRVRLRWRSVDQAESYRVYRATDGADPTLLENQIGSSQYEDVTPPPGTSVYDVTAVDAAGNESEVSSCTAARGAGL